MAEEDSEVEECACAVPFSTMPTLLHLKTMKNKLNVAYLSRDMLKWNSMSTENELKKISIDLQRISRNFAKSMRTGYLLLARCKYFNQEFYRNILEGAKTASVVVKAGRNMVAGVEMITYTTVVKKSKQKVPFISRGGQTIQEAKNTWMDLLKTHIKMVELKNSFLAVEAHYKDATKRQHIIDQIVVPKTQATIKYIIIELEEIKREESCRLKMMRKIRKCKEAKRVCPCTEVATRGKARDVKKGKNEKKTAPEPLPKSRSLIEEPTVTANKIYQPVIIPIDIPEVIEKRRSVRLKSQQVIETLRKFYELVSFHSGVEKEIPKKRLSLGDWSVSTLDSHKGDQTALAMNNFLEVCQGARHQLDNLTKKEKPCQVNTKLIGNLKSHIDTVINTNSRLHSTTVLAPNVKNFIKSCEKIDLGLKITTKDIDHTPLDDIGKKRVSNLIKNIDDVAKIITEYRNDGLLTPSLEEFSKVCDEAKAKIGVKVRNPFHEVQKLEYLKKVVTDVEKLTADITSHHMRSSSIEQFLSSCKGFKKKLDEHKKRVPKLHRRMVESQLEEIQFSESFQRFMTSCEDYIMNTQQNLNVSPEISDETFIEKISELMVKWRKQGILSKSTIDFMNCAQKRWTIDNSRNSEVTPDNTVYSSSLDKSIFKNFNNSSIVPPSCRNVYSLQTEICEMKNSMPPALSSKLPKKSIVSNKSNKKPVALVTRTEPLHSEEIESVGKMTQYPSKLIETDVPSRSFLDDTSLSLFTVSDEGMQENSEIIVAEISAYDSCPVLESNNKDIWILETRCFDHQPGNTDDPSNNSSRQSVEEQTCFVYDKEKPEECSLKKTYTM